MEILPCLDQVAADWRREVQGGGGVKEVTCGEVVTASRGDQARPSNSHMYEGGIDQRGLLPPAPLPPSNNMHCCFYCTLMPHHQIHQSTESQP